MTVPVQHGKGLRAVAVLTLILLLVPAAIRGQEKASGNNGHFDGWLSDGKWGADKQTFEVKFSPRRAEATFTVSEKGFGWVQIQTTFPETFVPWEDVTGWCTDSETRRLMVADQRSLATPEFSGFKPADFATVVNQYFRRYARDTEIAPAGGRCSRLAFQ